MIELQQQLRENGIEPKTAPTTAQNGYKSPSLWTGPQGQQAQVQAQALPAQTQTNGYATHSPTHESARDSPAPLLPDFRSGCVGDNYLGVSTENNWLSPIEGTSLALFGTKIDLAEFMPGDNDPEAMSMSYRTFLNHAYGRSHPFRPELPPYDQCKMYAEWYFRSIQPFIPVLHKPDFMRLIDKIHNESYQPRACEWVMVYMVLAVVNFQYSCRNANEQARQDSMSFYHYACSMIPDLITSHSLEDIQALALICSQLRNQPRPGAAWMFTNLVLTLAIESGLHRSAKAWQNAEMRKDPHHLEMRKRTFWTILEFNVHISGKLGRPMPLRLEDFDIEMPEAIPDNLPDEFNNHWKECSFRAGIEGFKLVKIMMQVYSSIYSIRSSTAAYETTVRSLEKELDAFHAQVPPEFRGGPQTKDEDRVSALYLDMSVAECQLLLHHPSLCPSTSAQVMSNNLDICLYWSNKLLQSAVSLKKLKALDTTWYYATDFLAAIFTTLFAHTQRIDEVKPTELQKLKHDMDQWIEVFAEVAILLGMLILCCKGFDTANSTVGATTQLHASIKTIVEASLSNIQNHLVAKAASAAVTTTHSSIVHEHSHSRSHSTNAHTTDYANGHSSGDMVSAHHGQAYTEQPSTEHAQQYAPLPDTRYAYAAPANGMYGAQNGLQSYGNEEYHNGGSKHGTVEEELVRAATLAQQQVQNNLSATNFLTSFASSPQVSNSFSQQPTYSQPGPAAWRHFADAMMHNVGGQDFVAAATMGGAADADQTWPLMHYSNSGGNPH